MKFIIPVESICQEKGGVILYDPINNKILKQYVHDKEWKYRVGWRGGTIFQDYLIATDWTDLHFFNIKKWKYEKTFTKNTFNDLHYVRGHNAKLFVVNTGIDAIEVFKNPLNPKFERMYFVFKQNTKLFGNRKIDLKEKYNERFKVKPHFCHPNCIEFDKGRIFVTCFEKKNRLNTGELIELKSGRRVISKNYSCHDGNFVGDDFYLSQTRAAKILVFENLRNKKLPVLKPDKVFSLGKKGWYRGCVIVPPKLYIFASLYTKKKETTKIAILDLNTGKTIHRRLPKFDGMFWDTVYQPNLLEE